MEPMKLLKHHGNGFVVVEKKRDVQLKADETRYFSFQQSCSLLVDWFSSKKLVVPRPIQEQYLHISGVGGGDRQMLKER